MGLLDLLFTKNYTNIDADELKELFKEKDKYQFLDVRTKQEFKHRRIKEFNKNIDYYKFARNLDMLSRIDMEKPVVIMCETGARSSAASHMLSKMGHPEVYNFRRGMSGWSGPVTKK